jgi:dTDP-glucose 4,6-dehydratase
MSRSLLITGGAGFIGTNFVHHWHQRHPEDHIIVLDALTYAGNLTGLKSLLESRAIHFVHDDIANTTFVEDLMREHEISHLVHFAAESHVDRSISGPDAFLETNILGTHSLLKAARKVWLEEGRGGKDIRFHHISTDEVYGSLKENDPAFTEISPYTPNSPYAASKAGSDHIVRAYHHTYGLPTLITNCSNNYGPYQYPEKLIPLMIINALRGKSLPVYGDGSNIRDWLYVEDHCRSIELVLLHGKPGDCYNIGGNNEVKNIDLVHSLCRLIDRAFTGHPSLKDRFPDAPAAHEVATHDLITFVADRPGHDRRYAIDATHINKELNFVPAETWETGLARTLQWYLNHEDWWRTIMTGSYDSWLDVNYRRRA